MQMYPCSGGRGRKRRPSPVVEQRLLHALPHGLKAGKVHARVELVLIEDALQGLSVQEVHLLRRGSDREQVQSTTQRTTAVGQARGATARVGWGYVLLIAVRSVAYATESSQMASKSRVWD